MLGHFNTKECCRYNVNFEQQITLNEQKKVEETFDASEKEFVSMFEVNKSCQLCSMHSCALTLTGRRDLHGVCTFWAKTSTPLD